MSSARRWKRGSMMIGHLEPWVLRTYKWTLWKRCSLWCYNFFGAETNCVFTVFHIISHDFSCFCMILHNFMFTHVLHISHCDMLLYFRVFLVCFTLHVFFLQYFHKISAGRRLMSHVGANPILWTSWWCLGPQLLCSIEKAVWKLGQNGLSTEDKIFRGLEVY